MILRKQIDSKKTLSCIDHQGKSFNTNIAKVQAQNVVFLPLDDIEFDWTTTNKFARLWFCEDIHHSSILKLAIKKQIRNLQMQIYQASCLKMIQTMKKISLLGLCFHTKRAHCDNIPYSQLCCFPY
jgi:hypothetical protein